MNNRYGKYSKRKWKMPVFVKLSYLLAVTLLFTGVTFAGFVTTASGSDEARVAAFVFYVQDSSTTKYVDLSDIEKPGDEREYVVTVSNKKDGRICEVAQDYSVGLKISGNMPLVCTVENQTIDLTQMAAGTASAKWETTGTFAAGQESAKTIHVKVKWHEDYTDAAYANGTSLAELQLTMESVQVN